MKTKSSNDGIIQTNSSDDAVPVEKVPKKDGTTRVCIDYRSINRKIVKHRYPLPNIEVQIDSLQGATIFTTLETEVEACEKLEKVLKVASEYGLNIKWKKCPRN